ncbi:MULTISPECIES: DNA recombination protein RmuC [unclassified Alcanivorax]|jgi:DNA recombination protein RmuC|uniref:DNA recombination protein RmuC n=1 Tax=unclassified Alcanivorax TaxID=2638842 RepID=UPI0008A05629|nr:DNA recombination protein RmuC [Alcanivorax sp. DSM 26293]MEE3387591.1 DNA recombination protein RmuC [Pseudomonadota bacterium]SEF38634.1 DNA recombination protein RmuC [Alcanivorax sp. DSM 26293]
MNPNLMLGLAALGGAVFAALLVLLMERRRSAAREAELVSQKQALSEPLAQVPLLREQLETSQRRLQDSESRLQQLASDKARLEERLAGQEEKLTFAEKSREQLKQEFENLSARIFEQRGKQLQEQQQQGLDGMLKPFREQLADFRRRVDQIHSDETRAQASLIEQLSQLRSLNQQMHEDARNLTDALKGQVKTQGNWGEMILERVLESSGLTRGREYETQVTLKDDSGQRRLPDAIVHLPENKDVVIDAKVSLVAYERLSSASTSEEREQALRDHLMSLRSHIKGLDIKDYSGLEGIRSLDFVLLFIPIEGAFMVAMEQDSSLYTDAFARNIVLVSPTTLLVTLRTIQNIWRYEYQNRNALDIADRAGKICDQVSLVTESLDDVGDKLARATSSWEQTRKRLTTGNGNLLRQAHQLKDLGAKARRSLPSPEEDDDAGVQDDRTD